MTGITINTALKVSNPNAGALDAIGMEFKVTKESDGTLLIDGNKEEPFQVPAKDSIETKIPILVHLKGLGAVGKSVVRRGQSTVIVQGSVTFDTPLAPTRTVTSKFEGKGIIDMNNNW
eukprot:CAMPEP_0194251308 /NCGR_PEP_ID=MMETSP0158-20130606/25148_1 /TAXON_ID=33649 /ORGANISM="Thalassionema nitzschioides, Strain L26-B" /LENGTH=117 /DNA_ID=CAMNT_0038988411 /DNA_START=103 /DNA_END=456 /DNA_ORIENTATION=+